MSICMLARNGCKRLLRKPCQDISTGYVSKCRPKLVNRRFSISTLAMNLSFSAFPSLAHDIAAIVDKTIMDSFNDNVQFPPSGTLLSVQQRDCAVCSIGQDVADEKAVASFYERTTATFCAPVASTLALRVSNWASLLVWTQSANVSGYATIADGFLTFAGPTSLAQREAELKQAMDEETFRLFRLLLARRASLMTSEFKNMAVGGPEVMLAIPNLSNLPSFDWTSCNAPKCTSTPNHKKELDKVKEVSVGPDAKTTPWTLPNNPISPSGSETVRPQPPTLPQSHEIGEIVPASAFALPAFVPPPLLSTGSSSVQGSSEDVRTSKAVKRKRNDGSSNESRASSSSTLGMLLMMPQANSPPAPETSSGSKLRKSSRIAAMMVIPAKKQRAAKKQKLDDPLNVCSSVYSVIMIAHDNFEGRTVYRFDATTIVTSRRCKNRFSKGGGEGEGRTRWRR
jgi:hypothetical protein